MPRQNFSKELTKGRLFDWQSALFPTNKSGMQRINVGGWRTIDNGHMQFVFGAIGREKIDFVASGAERLDV